MASLQRDPSAILMQPAPLADAAITQFYAVMAGSDQRHVAVVASAITNVPLGICDTGATGAEAQCGVVRFGYTWCVAHEAITAGQRLSTYSDGTLQPAASTAYPFAVACEDIASGGTGHIFVYGPTSVY